MFFALEFVSLYSKEDKMSDKPYKIVFCTPAIYSAGGVERVVSFKANYFAEQLDYVVTVIVTEGKKGDCYFTLSDKVKVVNYELGFEELWRASFLKKVFLYLRKQYKFRKMLTYDLMRIRPDITISTLRREINFLTKIHDGSVKIGELHVNRANYRSSGERNLNSIKRLFAHLWKKDLIGHLKKLDKMVVLTDSALLDWPELSNVVKIPDPLPFELDSNSNLSVRRIVSIGRYDYDKGNDLLLHVWSIVEKRVEGWHLDIYGNGNQEPYRHLISQLGIDQSRCHLHGPVKDVKKEYLNSSVFVLPSRYEGFGLVLIEAMACGVPVVSFDCENGPRSIITNGVDGFLISPFDIEAFAERIILLMGDDKLRKQMGENAQSSAAQYSIDRIGMRWEQLFNSLMENR